MKLPIYAVALIAIASSGAALAQRPGGRPFVSPAGQVFRQVDGGPRPMAAWFLQADTDRDGAITQAEFNADFERAFRAFDTNGDGEIDPDEVFNYETRIFPEMSGGGFSVRGAPTGRGSTMTSARSGGRGGSRARSPRMVGGAARFGLLPIYHPIMDADENMNRGISRGERAAAASRRFRMLDPSGTGRLTAPSIVEGRRPPPPAPPPPPAQ